MTPTTSSLGLVPNPIPQPPYVPPKKNDWDILFQPMFDEFFNPPSVCLPIPEVAVAPRPVPQTGSSSSNTIDQDPPPASNSSSQVQDQSPTISQGVAEQLQNTHLDHPVPEQVHNIRVILKVFTVKMEILLEPTSNKLMVVTYQFTLTVLSALRRSGNENELSTMTLTFTCWKIHYFKLEIPVKENYLSREVYLITCIHKDGDGGTCKRMSMLVQSSQCHKKAKQSQDDDLRFDLADDLKEAQDRKFIMQERASSRSCSLQFITR
ncbi:hypothetical protein Tco_0439480 [Tanacetum coccineum]